MHTLGLPNEHLGHDRGYGGSAARQRGGNGRRREDQRRGGHLRAYHTHTITFEQLVERAKGNESLAVAMAERRRHAQRHGGGPVTTAPN